MLDNVIESVSKFLSTINYSEVNINLIKWIIVILIISLFIILRKKFAKFIRKFIGIITKKLHIDNVDTVYIKVERPIRLFFVVLSIWIGLEILDLSGGLRKFFEVILSTLSIFTVGWFLFQFTDATIGFFAEKSDKENNKSNHTLFDLFNNGIKTIIVIMAVILAVNEWGYNIGAILTGLGLGGLAVALAAKDTLANLFGSIMIMLDRPFILGDWILTPTVEGTVEEIGFRSTKVRTFAQAIVSVPNSIISNEPVTNWTRMGKRRVNFNLGLTYDTSSEKIQLVVVQIRNKLKLSKEVHPETIMVYFDNFGDSALNIFIYFFTKTTDWKQYLEIKERINFDILKILETLNVSVAFPSTSVYIEKNNH